MTSLTVVISLRLDTNCANTNYLGIKLYGDTSDMVIPVRSKMLKFCPVASSCEDAYHQSIKPALDL